MVRSWTSTGSAPHAPIDKRSLDVPTLDIHHLSFNYSGSPPALMNIDFQVRAGEIIGLVGPNGSGKSTLIKSIFDLLDVRQGSIRILDYEHRSMAARQSAAYAASNDYLPGFLTGKEYVRLVTDLYGQEPTPEEIAAWFARFGMSGRQRHLIEDYSHGMRKKLQLLSCFMAERPLTILDETLNGIDLDARMTCEREFASIAAAGRSLVICTHEFELLERAAERIVYLDQGAIVFDAPTVDVVSEFGGISALVFDHLVTRAD